ncbi:MAG: BMP family ABC transporter substrate-binding protein [Candidatus Heimdallarchaeota archaeon]|nr:MAG: BMP family ABC transporter substrate-binding protein [Candidatus Heimdallarchaeota archaeon]
MKKVRILILALILLMPLATLSSVTGSRDAGPTKVRFSAGKATAKTKVGVVFATGGLGDKSFNDAGKRGVDQALADYPDNVTVNWVEPQDVPEFKTYQTDYAEDETYDLIICIGFLQTSALNETSITYPDQNWVLIDDEINRSNIQNYLFKEHEGSFLVGAMAAMTTETGKIGFVGGMDIYLINKFLAGYRQGAHYINDSIEVTAVYSPLPPPDCWNDIPSGKNMGKTLMGKDNDVVFAAAGGTGIGVFQAAEEEGVYAIGVDSDQDGEAKGTVLCSMLKLVETATYNAINDTIHGTWEAGTKTLGLAEEGVGISPMTYTKTEKETNYTFDGVSLSRWDHVMNIKQDIIDGTIKVKETPDWEKLQRIQMATPGFEGLLVVFMLIGLAAIQINRRRQS